MNKIGILGLGSIGRRHARILNSLDKNINFFAYRTKKGGLTDSPKYIENEGSLCKIINYYPLDLALSFYT